MDFSSSFLIERISPLVGVFMPHPPCRPRLLGGMPEDCVDVLDFGQCRIQASFHDVVAGLVVAVQVDRRQMDDALCPECHHRNHVGQIKRVGDVTSNAVGI